MARLKISPTRSNLMRIKRDLSMARQGYSLLDRKREVLTMNLMRMAHDAEDLQRQVDDLLQEAYAALRIANLTMGREMVDWTALATVGQTEISVLLRSVMGVVVPTIELEKKPATLSFGLGETTAGLDEARVKFHQVLELLPTLAEALSSVWRLATELRRTQRRVNALEHLFIPQYAETAKFIEESLEEKDREERFRLKRVKALTIDKEEQK